MRPSFDNVINRDHRKTQTAHAQVRAVAVCIAINVGADALGRVLLRDTAWPGWITLAIDAGLATLLWLGETWGRLLFMGRILLGFTAWPGWLHAKDAFSLAVSALSSAAYLLALWGGHHRRLGYVAYALSVIAATLVLCDAL